MLKIMAQLEHTIGSRIYRLSCDQDAPTTELKEVLFKFLQFVGQIEDQAKANAELEKNIIVETDIKHIDASQPIDPAEVML